MERNKFILTMLAASTIPLAAFPQTEKKGTRTDKGFKIKAGEGRIHGHIKMKGVNSNIIDVKVSGRDNDGGLAIFEQTSISQGKGTPMHLHHFQDETFYVLEGSYYFQVGDEKLTLNAGDCVFLPRKIPHAWTQASEKGKMMIFLQPAGKLEDFFVTMAALDHEPTATEIAQIFANNEMQVVGPPLKIE